MAFGLIAPRRFFEFGGEKKNEEGGGMDRENFFKFKKKGGRFSGKKKYRYLATRRGKKRKGERYRKPRAGITSFQ